MKLRELKKVIDECVKRLNKQQNPLVEIVISKSCVDDFQIYGICEITQSRAIGDLSLHVNTECTEDHLVR